MYYSIVGKHVQLNTNKQFKKPQNQNKNERKDRFRAHCMKTNLQITPIDIPS